MSTPTLLRARFAWCLYDWANSAFATVILAAVLPVYMVTLIPSGGVPLPGSGTGLPATAFWGYTVALSMTAVAVAAPLLGQLADRRGWRRPLLIAFCLLGSFATAALFFAGPQRYLLAAGLFVLANIGFAAGNIFYNAFLPDLASGKDADRLSSKGYAYGYLGGGLMLLIAFILIRHPGWFGLNGVGAATRTSFLLTGLWWLAFALPAFLWLSNPAPRAFPPRRGLRRSYREALSKVWRHRELRLFLIAFLLYNDGIQTMISVSAVFARDELKLSQGTILGCFLMIQLVATPGSLLFASLAERFGTRRIVMLSLLIFTLITLYASTMHSAAEFWGLGLAVAMVLGGSQALSRSLFVRMVPEQNSSEFFSFFAISTKFASIFGPLLFAALVHLSGSNRLAILGLSGFFVVGLVMLGRVDFEAGAWHAREVAERGHVKDDR